MNLLVRLVLPGVLLVLSAATALFAGTLIAGTDGPLGLAPAQGYAISVLLAIGTHAFGHFVVARRYGVDVSFPYFVPQPGITGVNGAYVKMRWPIEDRRALIRIFAAGPVAGFVMSAALLTLGVTLSSTAPRSAEQWVHLGDSLLTLAVQRLAFPDAAADQVVVAHPFVIAGYAGLNFGLWQLFPVGRFDGGRVVYALLGRTRALLVSCATIAFLVSLSLFWYGWLALAAFGALTLIRIERQQPAEAHTEALDRTSVALACAMLAILGMTFVPVPVRLG